MRCWQSKNDEQEGDQLCTGEEVESLKGVFHCGMTCFVRFCSVGVLSKAVPAWEGDVARGT
jgi:hypothetical protein